MKLMFETIDVKIMIAQKFEYLIEQSITFIILHPGIL